MNPEKAAVAESRRTAPEIHRKIRARRAVGRVATASEKNGMGAAEVNLPLRLPTQKRPPVFVGGLFFIGERPTLVWVT
ncbi:MAG: hypothetical protein LBP75_01535 [Planctomycetota bacterium]|jgi:hypothetical protein|nr:hypothetical protein [Planctomycetota bacterium]